MKDARYVIRLANTGFKPSDQADLLKKVRERVVPLGARAINLRVSRPAIEFDLFCPPFQPGSDPLLTWGLTPFARALESMGKLLTCKRLDVSPGPVDAQRIVDEARQLFNEERFWEVHEVLEGLWKETCGPEKEWLQGLILAAAALVHAQKDERVVAETMMKDAARRLSEAPESYRGLNTPTYMKVARGALENPDAPACLKV